MLFTKRCFTNFIGASASGGAELIIGMSRRANRGLISSSRQTGRPIF
jgi:hypothetical protein